VSMFTISTLLSPLSFSVLRVCMDVVSKADNQRANCVCSQRGWDVVLPVPSSWDSVSLDLALAVS
jgi:hypothetical protein